MMLYLLAPPGPLLLDESEPVRRRGAEADLLAAMPGMRPRAAPDAPPSGRKEKEAPR